jgi:hypothetical protein
LSTGLLSVFRRIWVGLTSLIYSCKALPLESGGCGNRPRTGPSLGLDYSCLWTAWFMTYSKLLLKHKFTMEGIPPFGRAIGCKGYISGINSQTCLSTQGTDLLCFDQDEPIQDCSCRVPAVVGGVCLTAMPLSCLMRRRMPYHGDGLIMTFTLPAQHTTCSWLVEFLLLSLP